MSKRGQSGTAGVFTLIGLGLALVVYGVVSSFGAEVISDIGDDFTADSVEDNITDNALEGISTASEKVPTIARVQVAAIIIGIIMLAFGGYMGIRTA